MKSFPAGGVSRKINDRRALSDFIERCYQLYEQKMYHAASGVCRIADGRRTRCRMRF